MHFFQRCDWQVGLCLQKPRDVSTQSPNDNSISAARPFHLADFTLIFLLSFSLLGAVHYAFLICFWELLSLTVCLKEAIQLGDSSRSLFGKASYILQRDWGALS